MTAARPREIWTRLAVDPLADPLARRLARHRVVTPDRVTLVALGLGVAAAACFATGQLLAGGLLFLVRFFADCLDGKIARLQESASSRGAFLDLAADVLGVTLAFAALSWHLVSVGVLPPAVALGLLASLVVYNWALDHRKSLAPLAGMGNGGHDHERTVRTPVVRSWVGLCRRLGMSPVPWAVECEIATLGLAPVLLPVEGVAVVVALALAFYVVADLVNLRRLWRITSELDQPPSSARRSIGVVR